MAEPGKQRDWTKLWVFLGLAAYVCVCVGGIYLLTGEIVGEKGFKGLLAGSLGTLFGFLILGAFASSVLDRWKEQPFKRAWASILVSGLFLALVLGFTWRFTKPVLHARPERYFAPPDTQYEVTYTSGKKEMKTGAQLGEESWSWDVGLYFSISLVGGLAALWALQSGFKDLRGRS